MRNNSKYSNTNAFANPTSHQDHSDTDLQPVQQTSAFVTLKRCMSTVTLPLGKVGRPLAGTPLALVVCFKPLSGMPVAHMVHDESPMSASEVCVKARAGSHGAGCMCPR